jgi:hypothetical protein
MSVTVHFYEHSVNIVAIFIGLKHFVFTFIAVITTIYNSQLSKIREIPSLFLLASLSLSWMCSLCSLMDAVRVKSQDPRAVHSTPGVQHME